MITRENPAEGGVTAVAVAGIEPAEAVEAADEGLVDRRDAVILDDPGSADQVDPEGRVVPVDDRPGEIAGHAVRAGQARARERGISAEGVMIAVAVVVTGVVEIAGGRGMAGIVADSVADRFPRRSSRKLMA